MGEGKGWGSEPHVSLPGSLCSTHAERGRWAEAGRDSSVSRDFSPCLFNPLAPTHPQHT